MIASGRISEATASRITAGRSTTAKSSKQTLETSSAVRSPFGDRKNTENTTFVSGGFFAGGSQRIDNVSDAGRF